MRSQAFAPGFRLSILDVVVLVAGTAAAVVLSLSEWWWGFVIAFVLGHFFLFCNVVRMSRLFELIWAGVFVALASSTVAVEFPGWSATTLASLTLAAVLVMLEARKASYHGVCWQRINPDLPKWWPAHMSANAGAESPQIKLMP